MFRTHLLGKYPLDSISQPGGTIIWYTLIFNERGELAVEEYYDLDQPYKNDRSTDISPENFDKYQVNGVPLRELVIKKLKEILPPPPPSRSCIQPTGKSK